MKYCKNLWNLIKIIKSSEKNKFLLMCNGDEWYFKIDCKNRRWKKVDIKITIVLKF